MKKGLLSSLLVCLGFVAHVSYAQLAAPGSLQEATYQKYHMDPQSRSAETKAGSGNGNGGGFWSAANIARIQIGQAGNAFGMIAGVKNNIDYNPQTDLIAVIHRNNEPVSGAITGPANRLVLNYSTDNAATWTQRIIYQSGRPGSTIPYDSANARYPQGMIFNPPGNTDPNNAYFTFYGAGLDGTNENRFAPPSPNDKGWGGFAYGTAQIDGSNFHDNNISSDTVNGIAHLIADAFWVTQGGKSYVAMPSYTPIEGGTGANASFLYGDILLYSGFFDPVGEKFDYSLTRIPYGGNRVPSDMKIAFGPAPMDSVGYITAIAYLGDAANPVDNNGRVTEHLVIWKTTDYGATWVGPISSPIMTNPYIERTWKADTTESYYIPVGGDFKGTTRADLRKAYFDNTGSLVGCDTMITEGIVGGTPTQSAVPRPIIGANFNHDIVVDKNGDLHMGLPTVVRGVDSDTTLGTFLIFYRFGKMFYLKFDKDDLNFTRALPEEVRFAGDINRSYRSYDDQGGTLDSTNILSRVDLSIDPTGRYVVMTYDDEDAEFWGPTPIPDPSVDFYSFVIDVDQAPTTTNPNDPPSTQSYSKIRTSALNQDFSARDYPENTSFVFGEFHYMSVSPHLRANNDTLFHYILSQSDFPIGSSQFVYVSEGFYNLTSEATNAQPCLECPDTSLALTVCVPSSDSLVLDSTSTDTLVNLQDVLVDVKGVEVFPNPTTGNAILAIDAAKDFNGTLLVRNMMGQVVSEEEISVIQGSNQFTINLEGQENGVYLYSIVSSGSVETGRIIKQ